MHFPQALYAIQDGRRLTRQSWQGLRQWVEMDGEQEQLNLYYADTDGNLLHGPFHPVQSDLFANDWMLFR